MAFKVKPQSDIIHVGPDIRETNRPKDIPDLSNYLYRFLSSYFRSFGDDVILCGFNISYDLDSNRYLQVQVSPGSCIVKNIPISITDTINLDLDLLEYSANGKVIVYLEHNRTRSNRFSIPTINIGWLDYNQRLTRPEQWDTSKIYLLLGVLIFQKSGNTVTSVTDVSSTYQNSPLTIRDVDYYIKHANCGSGSGISGINVYDEGSLVCSNATDLNFIGSDVLADGTNCPTVDIYIPPPNYASHFNTTDGSTNGTVVEPSYTNRYISQPTSPGNPFTIGSWTPGTQHPATANATQTWVTAEQISFLSGSYFDIIIRDGDGNIVDQLTTPSLNGNYTGSSSSNGINLTISNWSPDQDKYKADFNLNLDYLNLFGGNSQSFTVDITHYDGADGNFTYSLNQVFFDRNALQVSVQSISFLQNTINSSKYLSGVRFYDIGDTFDLGGVYANVNKDTWPEPVAHYDPSQMAISVFDIHHSDFSGYSLVHDDTPANFADTRAIDIHNYRRICTAATITTYINDWSSNEDSDNTSFIALIDTYAPSSDDTHEYFDDERYRVTPDYDIDTAPSSALGEANWDSTVALGSAAPYDNGLQVINSTLIYPGQDFSNCNPSGNPDYSGLTGNRVYLRFYQSTISHTNGTLRIVGPPRPDIENGVVLVELCVTANGAYDGTPQHGTQWLDLSQWYNSATFQGANGDGCRTGGSGNDYTFTLGSFSTYYANNCLLIRVTMPDTYTGTIDEISIIDW